MPVHPLDSYPKILILSVPGRSMTIMSTKGFTMSKNIIALAFLLASSTAFAGIDSLGGGAVIAEPPKDIRHDMWESDTEIRVWFENEVVVSTNSDCGRSLPGFVDDVSQLDGAPLEIGSTVNSYMIRFDPVGSNEGSLVGFVVFEEPILSAWIGTRLNPTDNEYGRPGITYNKNTARGMELEPNNPNGDSFEISRDRMRIDFSMNIGLGGLSWTDDIRVITTTQGPGPCSSADLSLPFGLYDLSDITTFISAFVNSDVAADLNEDGVLDLADTVLFVTEFTNGCD